MRGSVIDNIYRQHDNNNNNIAHDSIAHDVGQCNKFALPPGSRLTPPTQDRTVFDEPVYCKSEA